MTPTPSVVPIAVSGRPKLPSRARTISDAREGDREQSRQAAEDVPRNRAPPSGSRSSPRPRRSGDRSAPGCARTRRSPAAMSGGTTMPARKTPTGKPRIVAPSVRGASIAGAKPISAAPAIAPTASAQLASQRDASPVSSTKRAPDGGRGPRESPPWGLLIRPRGAKHRRAYFSDAELRRGRRCTPPRAQLVIFHEP